MFHLLAQTTQEAVPTGVWTNITTEKLGFWIALYTGGLMAAIYGLGKIGNAIIETWFGWRKSIRQRQEELEKKVQVLAQASPVSSAPVTNHIVDQVNAIANGEDSITGSAKP